MRLLIAVGECSSKQHAKFRKSGAGGGRVDEYNLKKPDTYLIFPEPHDMAPAARLVAVKYKVERTWDWAINNNLGPSLRKTANHARNRSAGGPNYLGSF
jgi:hypothetical protein